MKSDLFQSCGHCWVFQICWHIECNTFTASSFRIWNSSTGIPSPPLALFVGMLSKAHLTSHSRISGSRWVITPSWLSGSWSSFLYSSVYFYHLFLIFSASVRSIPFLSFIEPIFAWNVPLVSLIFLKRSLVLSTLVKYKIIICNSLKDSQLFSFEGVDYLGDTDVLLTMKGNLFQYEFVCSGWGDVKAQPSSGKLEIWFISDRGPGVQKHQRANLCIFWVNIAFLIRPFKIE